MNPSPSSVEERIIVTTIDCIETYGMAGATNRRIAQAAGVNIAAINYYFRSKEQLMQRVMEITLKNAFDLSNLPPMPGALAQDRCLAIFGEILEGGLRYPNITRAHFHNLLVEGQPDAVLQKHVTHFIEQQAQDLQTRGLALPPAEIKATLMQIFSAVAMLILAPTLFEQPDLNLTTPEARMAYLTRLVTRLIP